MFRRCQFILLAAVLVFTGCSKKAAIPPNKMALILHDMYMLDAEIESSGSYSLMADTSSVYGGLFEQYGYSVEDFNSSLDFYLNDPMTFKEIFKKALDRFEKEAKAYELTEATEAVEMNIEEPEDKRAGRRRGRHQSAPPVEEEIE
ncbi:MAG: DUF4296 domain-containing protein [Bacteroidales bacterium]|nr:DUF4296 domain-containing protein [Bacteroidales bacterium]MBO7584764.1 DUF4296 domain-containing protein [Bacteroidales bacterium]